MDRALEPSRAVLITGCSSGIGRATAVRLAASGWTVYASARRLETIVELEDLGCRTLALDVTDERSMRRAVREVERVEGAVGVLINNAGYGQAGALETIPLDEARLQFETNVFGPMRLIQLVAEKMRRQRWGKIVNVGSMGGRLTLPGGGYYHGTKYALEAISDLLRFELRGFGIDVILIEPGLIETGFAKASLAGMAERSLRSSRDTERHYADFNSTIAALTRSVYDSPLRYLGGAPDHVASAIETALSRHRAPARVTVTLSAKLAIAARRLLADLLWDELMRRLFPQPGQFNRSSH